MKQEATFRCEQCKRVLPLSEFNVHPDYPDLHCHWCKQCEATAQSPYTPLFVQPEAEPEPQTDDAMDQGEPMSSESTPPVAQAQPEGTKRCPRCGQVKILDAFYRDRSRTDGYAIYCKACQDEMNKAARQARAEGEEPVPQPIYPPEHKACPRCGLVKPYGEFYNDRRRSDGKSTYCKVCHGEISKSAAQRAQETLGHLLDLVAEGMEEEALMELREIASG